MSIGPSDSPAHHVYMHMFIGPSDSPSHHVRMRDSDLRPPPLTIPTIQLGAWVHGMQGCGSFPMVRLPPTQEGLQFDLQSLGACGFVERTLLVHWALQSQE